MGTSYLRLLTRKENREVEMAQLSKKPGDDSVYRDAVQLHRSPRQVQMDL